MYIINNTIKTRIRKLRKRGFSLDHISQRLKINRGTIYYWINKFELNGIKIRHTKKVSLARYNQGMKMMRASQEQFRKKREDAKQRAYSDKNKLYTDRHFRDFLILYAAEGGHKDTNSISLSNTDVSIIKIALHFFKKISTKQISFRVFCHKDGINSVRSFWAHKLDIPINSIKTYIKKSPRKRKYHPAVYGVMAIRANDTYAQIYILTLIDLLKEEWGNLSI